MDEKYLNMVFTEHTALRTLCAYIYRLVVVFSARVGARKSRDTILFHFSTRMLIFIVFILSAVNLPRARAATN